jgi:hypothetical protein
MDIYWLYWLSSTDVLLQNNVVKSAKPTRGGLDRGDVEGPHVRLAHGGAAAEQLARRAEPRAQHRALRRVAVLGVAVQVAF